MKSIKNLFILIIAVTMLTKFSVNAQERTNHGDDVFPDDLFLPEDRIPQVLNLAFLSYRVPESRLHFQAAKGINSASIGSEVRIYRKFSTKVEIGISSANHSFTYEFQPTIYVTPYTFKFNDKLSTTRYRLALTYRAFDFNRFAVETEAGFQIIQFKLKSQLTEIPASLNQSTFIVSDTKKPNNQNGFFAAAGVDFYLIRYLSGHVKFRKDFLSKVEVNSQDVTRRITTPSSVIDNDWGTVSARSRTPSTFVVEIGVKLHLFNLD